MIRKSLAICVQAVLLLSSAFAQNDDKCPAQVTRFEIRGGFEQRSQYALIYLENRGLVAIQAIEYQFQAYDSERRRTRVRYYLDAGKVDGGLGKPIPPGKTRGLQGMVSQRLGILYGNWSSDGSDIKLNVIHFTDGSKWERKGWKDEPNPNQ